MAMTFGIHIGHLGGPLDEMRKLWQFADTRGFDWFSTSDHFQESPPAGGDIDCFECFTTLTAAAVETTRVRLGTLVACINYRNPGLLAKIFTSIDHLSHGRAEVGIGAGWHGVEYTAFGIPFERIGIREDQLEEYAQVLRLLFDEKRANFKGQYFQLENAPNYPRPVQTRMRIWIGGGGEKRTLRAVARYADGWNAPYFGPEQWKAKNAILDQWCEKEGRDPRSILRTANAGFYLGADAAGAARHEKTFQSHFGNDARARTGFFRGTPKDAVELAGRYRDVGCQRRNIAFRQGPNDWDALNAFADEVLPAFGITRPARAGRQQA